ncbi:MAG: hypothetical protein ABUL41_00195 [Chitinophagaceae bacterium]
MYTTRPAGEVRPTNDVDILIELIQYKDYALIEEKLRAKGFVNDTESGVICRYIIQGIIVDIMPTEESILGFNNHWYPDGCKTAMEETIDDGYTIRIFRPEYFIASKLEAFGDRGERDGRMSSDFEDVVFILNNREEIWNEMKASLPELKAWLKEIFAALLANDNIYEWISAHLDYAEQGRVTFIIGGMQEFVENS